MTGTLDSLVPSLIIIGQAGRLAARATYPGRLVPLPSSELGGLISPSVSLSHIQMRGVRPSIAHATYPAEVDQPVVGSEHFPNPPCSPSE